MSNSSRAATELESGLTYDTDDLNGFIEADNTNTENGNTNVIFASGSDNFFNIGANGDGSVYNQGDDSSTLNIEITESTAGDHTFGAIGTSGIIFEDDVTAANGMVINLNVRDGNVIFRGNLDGASNDIRILAQNDNAATVSKLDFQIAHDEDLNIYATINKEDGNSDTLNMTVANTSGNAAREITFHSSLGGVDASRNSMFISNLTIGDSGAAKTNNVNFTGPYINTNGINIGVSERSEAQNHNITFQNTEVRGAITGLAADNITITQAGGVTTTFYNAVSNIDNFIVTTDSTAIFRGDVSDSSINLRASAGASFISGEARSNISADITQISNYATIRFDGVNFDGSVTAGDDSGTNIITVVNRSAINGDIALADGNDTIDSLSGNNTFSSNIDFGAGNNDTLSLSDSYASLNGAITNLENITIGENAILFVYQGGSYSGNVNGNNASGALSIGAYYSSEDYAISDDDAFTYNSPGTIDNVGLEVGGNATFNTNGHEFGSESSLRSLDIYGNGTFNIQDNVTVGAGGRTSMYENSTIIIGASAKLTTSDFYSDSAADSTLIFDLASSSQAGYLEVTTGNIDLENVTVEANLTGLDSAFRNGNQIKVAEIVGGLVEDTFTKGNITGTSGEEGQAATTITENSALFSIQMMDGSKLQTPTSSSALYFVFSQDSTIEEIAVSGNNKNVGSVFDNLINTSNSELSQIINKINTASEGELQTLLESTTPDVGGGVAVGSQNFVNNTLDITNQQIDIAMNSHAGLASGDKNKGIRTWGQYFFEDATQGKRQGIAGFNSTTNGVALGIDSTELLENSVIGLGVSFGNTKVDAKNANRAENRIDSYQITGYGSYSLPANYFIKAMAAYAYNEVKSTRHNIGNLNLNARGEYSANIYTFRADAGKDFYHNGTTRFTPSLMTHYSLYNAQNYSETGAGGSNLNVNSKSLEIFELGTNFELGWDFKLGNEKRFLPEIRAGYRYNLIGDRFRANSSFAGGGATSFDTVGASPAKGALTFGGGLIYQASDKWDLSLNYEYEKRQNFHSNSGFARAAYHF